MGDSSVGGSVVYNFDIEDNGFDAKMDKKRSTVKSFSTSLESLDKSAATSIGNVGKSVDKFGGNLDAGSATTKKFYAQTSASFAAIDRDVSSGLSIAGQSVSKFGATVEDHTSKVDKDTSSIGSSFESAGRKIVAYGGLTTAIYAVKSAITTSVLSFADFDSKLGLLKTTVAATGPQMDQLSKYAIALGNDINLPGVSASDATDAMLELGKAGLSVADIIGATKPVLQTAKAGNLDFAASATIISNAMLAFGIHGKDAAVVSDLFAAAANASSADISDLGLALSQTSAQAASFKVPLNDTVTALAGLANAGVRGSDAGTSLKVFLQSLVPTSKAAADEFETLGIHVFDAAGKFTGLQDTIGQFATATSKLTDEQKQQALQTIFGSDASRAANILVAQGVTGFENLSKAVNKQGQAAALTAAQNSGIKGSLDALSSNFSTVALQAGGFISKGLKPITDFMSANMPVTIGVAITLFGGLGVALVSATIGFGALATGIASTAVALGGFVLLPALVVGGLIYLQEKFNIFGVAWTELQKAFKEGKQIIADIGSAFVRFGTDVVGTVVKYKEVATAIGIILLPVIAKIGIVAGKAALDTAVAAGKIALNGARAATGWVISTAGDAFGWIASMAKVVASSAKQAVLIAASGLKAAGGWVLSSYGFIGTFAKIVASAVSTAVVVAANGIKAASTWVAQAVAVGAAWTGNFIAMQAKAVWAGIEMQSPALAAGLTWIAQAVASGASWAFYFASLVVQAIGTGLSVAAQGIVAGATWLVQPLLILGAWVGGLASVAFEAASTAVGVAGSAVAAGVSWLAQPVLMVVAWAGAKLSIVADMASTAVSSAISGSRAALPWILGAAASAGAWALNALKMLPYFVGIAIGSTANALIASAAWVGAAVATAAAWVIANIAILGVVGVIIAVVAGAAALIIGNWQNITNAASAAWAWIQGVVSGFIGWIGDHWPLVLAIIAGPIGLAVLFFIQNFETIKTVAGNVVNSIAGFFSSGFNGIRGVIGGVVDFIASIPGRVGGFFGGFGSLLYDKGRDLVNGLLNGAGSILPNIGKFFLDKLPDWIRDPFKKAMGIHSPSTVFAGFGVNLGQGLVNGLASTEGMVSDAMSNLSDKVNLDTTMNIGASANGSGAVVGSALASTAVAGARSSKDSTVVHLHMDGLIAKSRSDFRELMKDGIEAVNEELRARRKPEIANGLVAGSSTAA
jgi:TP901 family phage tail tape measure protein